MKTSMPNLSRGHAALLAFATRICTFSSVRAQQSLRWDQVKARFDAANPALKTDAYNVDEMRAEEIRAYLHPNPQFTQTVDGTAIAPSSGAWVPLQGTFVSPNISYLHEWPHKHELRLESAKDSTLVTRSQHADLERNLIFNLRAAFVQAHLGWSVFEEIYAQWLQGNAQQCLALNVCQMTRYWSRDGRTEIDLMAELDSGTFFFGECKLRSESIARLNDLSSCKRRSPAFPRLGWRNKPSYILFALGSSLPNCCNSSADPAERLYFVAEIVVSH